MLMLFATLPISVFAAEIADAVEENAAPVVSVSSLYSYKESDPNEFRALPDNEGVFYLDISLSKAPVGNSNVVVYYRTVDDSAVAIWGDYESTELDSFVTLTKANDYKARVTVESKILDNGFYTDGENGEPNKDKIISRRFLFELTSVEGDADLSEDKSELFLSCLASDALADGLLLRHEAESVLLSILDAHNVRLENTRFSPVVVRAIKYIKRNLSAQLTVSEIAEHAFVSTSTLTKKFKAELSKSVSEYVNDRIMFEASQRLLKTNLSVLAISEKYGFSDQFYFSRRFKEKFGLSPMKYRKTTIM